VSGSSPVLSVRDLTVEVATEAGRRIVVDRMSFDVAPGETLCLAGESGSGKSMTALSLMRLLPEPMSRIAKGTISLGGRELTALPERELRRVRGGEIAMIFQEPMTSLNPVLSIGRQLSEAISVHSNAGKAEARKRAVEALSAVRIGSPERLMSAYPHELSGGMRQRVMIAMAISGSPKLLIADEPTTALDVTVQAQILELIRRMQRDAGTALLLITHDMGVVAEMADRVIVMHSGRAVESGPVREIFSAPKDSYTRSLLAAVPRIGARHAGEPPRHRAPVVRVDGLTVRFDILGGVLRRPVKRVHAVEDVSFEVARGETLAIVGESGCGKSTTGRALLNLLSWHGEIEIDGTSTRGLSPGAMKPVRRSIQMIFQDPYASLDPRVTVGELVAEPLRVHGLASGSEVTDRVAGLFQRVGLSPDHLRRHPHEFSGGQRQRICVARALSLSPKVIVADESVSSLDVSVQARVLDLLEELQSELGLSYVFISHNMAVVDRVSHRVAVMYLGRIVEMGSRVQVFGSPRHPYTRRLLAAVLAPDPNARRGSFPIAEGDVPTAVHPVGYVPPRSTLVDIGDGHLVAA
jgi:peptide/nickel transport system ATP-binding protein